MTYKHYSLFLVALLASVLTVNAEDTCRLCFPPHSPAPIQDFTTSSIMITFYTDNIVALNRQSADVIEYVSNTNLDIPLNPGDSYSVDIAFLGGTSCTPEALYATIRVDFGDSIEDHRFVPADIDANCGTPRDNLYRRVTIVAPLNGRSGRVIGIFFYRGTGTPENPSTAGGYGQIMIKNVVIGGTNLDFVSMDPLCYDYEIGQTYDIPLIYYFNNVTLVEELSAPKCRCFLKTFTEMYYGGRERDYILSFRKCNCNNKTFGDKQSATVICPVGGKL